MSKMVVEFVYLKITGCFEINNLFFTKKVVIHIHVYIYINMHPVIFFQYFNFEKQMKRMNQF